MPGIYIHIPFCRQACSYCDFHFSTVLKGKKQFIDALKKEISLRKDYLSEKSISTIYFGGGTPSLLEKGEILEIFSEISKYFSIDKDAEITLEANPDDLSAKRLKELTEQTPVNRLSIGIQSFSDEDLKFLNRVHHAKDAVRSVRDAKEAGFNNITIDLIYGIQTLTDDQWKKNMKAAFELDVPHISCYSLTVEPKTPLHTFIRKGKVKELDPERSAGHFEMLMDEMGKNDFVHYEISNFCKEGYYSRHNSNYWKGETYLGLGPSAHSYDGSSRQWNVSSNSAYIRSMEEGKVPFEKEVLTLEQQCNEYVLTSLRTIWGTDAARIGKQFSKGLRDSFEKAVSRHLESKMISKKENMFYLTRAGKLFADRVASDLFVV